MHNEQRAVDAEQQTLRTLVAAAAGATCRHQNDGGCIINLHSPLCYHGFICIDWQHKYGVNVSPSVACLGVQAPMDRPRRYFHD